MQIFANGKLRFYSFMKFYGIHLKKIRGKKLIIVALYAVIYFGDLRVEGLCHYNYFAVIWRNPFTPNSAKSKIDNQMLENFVSPKVSLWESKG